MKLFSSFRRCLFHLFFIAALSLTLIAATAHGKEHVKIGVLANLGKEAAVKLWTPTADYIASQIPEYSFAIIPLSFDEISQTVERGEVDFVLTNPSVYVELEHKYGVSRIATIDTMYEGMEYNRFGGVIFTRADRVDIKDMHDLKGKTFIAVHETSFGGWLAARKELKAADIDIYRHFTRLMFSGESQEQVVLAVRDRKADAGTVRTGILENMTADGKIRLEDFKMLNPQNIEGFALLLSTNLYPEWAFGMLRHTSDELAEKVAAALLMMPSDSNAAMAAKIAGFTIPLDYHPVHELMKELRIPPYEDYGKVTFSQALRKYWFWFVIAFSALFVMGGVSVYVLRLRYVVVQLRLAEDQLREKTDKFRHVFESSNVGKSITFPAGNIDPNKAFADMLGYTIDELRGKTWQELTPSDEIEAIQKRLALLLSGEKDSARFEKRYIHKNGLYIWADVSVAIQRDSDNNPLYFMTTIVDITERKKAEHDRQKFVMLADSSSEFIGMCDLDLNPIYVNPAGVRMVGLPDMAAACRIKVQDYFFPEDQKFIAEEFFPRVMREGHGEVETRLRHFQTGEPIWMSYYLFHVRDSGGALVGWATVSHNITERRRTEEDLRITNEELLAINRIISTTTTTTGVKQILESTLDEALNITGIEGGTICMVTPEQTLHLMAYRETSETTINDLTENEIKIGDCLCGECAKDHKPLILWNREEVLEFATREATRGEDIRFHAAFPLIMGEKCLGVLCVFTRTDKKPTERRLKLLETVTSQIAIAVDNAQMFEEISRHAADLENRVRERTADLQEKTQDLERSQKALQHLLEDVNEANEKLKELDRLKSMFIASMSHELRTPLNSVIGFSGIMLNQWAGKINEEQKELLTIVSRAGKHLLALINDVIDVSKIEAGIIDIHAEAFDLQDVLNEAVNFMKKEISEKKLELNVNAASLQMHTDRRRLLQCVTNLISNAVKFTVSGSISIETSVVGDRVEIAVEDTGIGIKEEDIPKLFKSFVRLESPLRATVPGTGLGLYLTKKLTVQVLKGDIMVKSEEGKGSRFTLRIPINVEFGVRNAE